MRVPAFTKFSFRIRTRDGLVVDNLLIHGNDAVEAERKLRQMYHGCEVLECVCQVVNPRKIPDSYEDVLGLIAR